MFQKIIKHSREAFKATKVSALRTRSWYYISKFPNTVYLQTVKRIKLNFNIYLPLKPFYCIIADMKWEEENDLEMQYQILVLPKVKCSSMWKGSICISPELIAEVAAATVLEIFSLIKPECNYFHIWIITFYS